MGQGWGEEARQGVWLEAHLSIGRAGGHLTRFPSQRLPLVGTGSEARRAPTSTLVMSQSLTALLWTPLVTIWKPLAVAVCSSTEDRGGEGRPEPGGLPGPEPACSPPQHPRLQGFSLSKSRTDHTD